MEATDSKSSVLTSVMHNDSTIIAGSEQPSLRRSEISLKKNSRSVANNEKRSYFDKIKKRAKKEQLKHIQNKITKFEF